MATMAASPLFIDANVLVYATNPNYPQHTSAIEALQSAQDSQRPCHISTQVIREYYNGMTKAPGTVMPPIAPVLANIAAFQRLYTVLEDTQRVLGALLTLVQTTPVGGRQVHDANIVATMLAYGIGELLTNNPKDFRRFASVITVRPLT